MKKRIVVSFSGGKDSMLALHRLQRSGMWEIDSLLVTLTEEERRISGHGLRYEMLALQAESLGIPLREVWMPEAPANDEYNARIQEALASAKSDGAEYVMFGDIFLEDLREYREKMIEPTGMKAVFPLWRCDTRELLQEFLSEGFKTVLISVDTRRLNPSFGGRVIDSEFLEDYPGEHDLCGEYGEYHTFVFDGPGFSFPIRYRLGDARMAHDMMTNNDRYLYVDLLV
ncbi:diphthine--ammonia ligase [Peribacillus sp. SCS-37]|uniref:Dph6-related ATP pyrophosphatase n=1 Tax=Paraperibacillus esterisolvens TaxID=3115296 RepID=UPI003905D22B